MKFIDFSSESFECVSPQQWRTFAEMEYNLSNSNANEQEENKKQINLVCLGYDDGKRTSVSASWLGPVSLRKTLVHKDKITCKCAVITFDPHQQKWFFTLEEKGTILYTSQPANFETWEEAIEAAKLCKDAKDIYEMYDILARKYPKQASKIYDYVSFHKSMNGETTEP